jgi:hypothetical protein
MFWGILDTLKKLKKFSKIFEKMIQFSENI